MQEFLAEHLVAILHEIASLDRDVVLLMVLLVISVIVIDAVSAFARKVHTKAGLSRDAVTVSVDGGKALTVREYISDIQGLAGRPDAVVMEGGYLIPVERKPTARKLHDRYVAQLLVYMRLIEEFEGKRPPYGYLILGPSARRFKIENSDARQAWLQSMIDGMRSFLENGAPLTPSPHPRKCARCEVRGQCAFSAAPATTEGVASDPRESPQGLGSAKED